MLIITVHAYNLEVVRYLLGQHPVSLVFILPLRHLLPFLVGQYDPPDQVVVAPDFDLYLSDLALVVEVCGVVFGVCPVALEGPRLDPICE